MSLSLPVFSFDSSHIQLLTESDTTYFPEQSISEFLSNSPIINTLVDFVVNSPKLQRKSPYFSNSPTQTLTPILQRKSPCFTPILKRALRDAVAETAENFMDLGIRRNAVDYTNDPMMIKIIQKTTEGIRRNAVDYTNDEFMLQIIQKATEEVRRGCRRNAVDATHNQELLETIKEAVKESMQQILYSEI